MRYHLGEHAVMPEISMHNEEEYRHDNGQHNEPVTATQLHNVATLFCLLSCHAPIVTSGLSVDD